MRRVIVRHDEDDVRTALGLGGGSHSEQGETKKPKECAHVNAQCSMFNVQCSMLMSTAAIPLDIEH
jgi:hypothetical protein